jgi:hypothetical protein
VVTPVLQIGGAVAAVAGLIAGTVPAVRWVRRMRNRRRLAGHGGFPRRPLQVVAADVRRLARELALVPAGAPVDRRLAVAAAFDDVLVEAALLLEVPHALPSAPVGPARDLERMRLLGGLERAGLAVHA